MRRRRTVRSYLARLAADPMILTRPLEGIVAEMAFVVLVAASAAFAVVVAAFLHTL